MEPESHVGRRVREIRSLRGLTLTACAELAGMSKASLSRIEHGEQGVSRKLTLERLAGVLRVAPSELTGQPFRAASPEEVQSHAAVDALRGVLRDIEIDAVDPRLGSGDIDRPGALDEDVARAEALKTAGDYGALGLVVPELLARTHLLAAGSSAQALITRVRTLICALRLAKNLGYHDVAWSAARHLRAAAAAVGDPAWIGIADFQLAEAMTGTDARVRALAQVRRAANDIGPGAGPVGEAYGMLRLSAAFLSTVMGDTAAGAPFVDEAADVARHTGEGTFAGQHFGPRNVNVWRVKLAVESGDVEAVPELARDVEIEAIPSPNIRASFLMDLGRGLAARRGGETAAVEALARAEALAPQHVHAHPYARETVGDLLRRARRDAGGRELRGLAYRMGLGV